MKIIMTVLVVLLHVSLLTGQTFKRDTTGLQTLKVYNGKKLYKITEYDKNGNVIFSRKDDTNEGGNIYLYSISYDSLNREIFSISARSGSGFDITQKVYEPMQEKTYAFILDSANEFIGYYLGEATLEIIKNFTTKEELDNCLPVKKLLEGKKRLEQIQWFNANQQLIKKVEFEGKEDTAHVNIYEYDSVGKRIHLNSRQVGSMRGALDYYSKYDKRGNEIEITRVENYTWNGRDTTEKMVFEYSESNKKLKRTDIHFRKVSSYMIYKYDRHNRNISWHYYVTDVEKPVEINRFKYNKEGQLTRMLVEKNGSERFTFNYRYERKYWPK